LVGRKKRRGKTGLLSGNHQKCWLWGRHAVLETLRARRWRPLELYWAPEQIPTSAQAEIRQLAAELQLPFLPSTSEALLRLCGARDHQGLLAKMPPFPYTDPAELAAALPEPCTVLILCGLQDPFNFGSILRSADLFSIHAVVVPTTGQVDVTPHVVRSSVGAVNYLPLTQVDDLADYCRQLKRRGIRLLAASEQGTASPSETDLTGSLALLIGNEGTGIPPELLAHCDAQLRIPQQGHVGSLNAAVAAGILCYEVQRQRAASH
jgi:23S rRNA (guanosine2251-2'-O)-methyltransferase